jgi:hypothetical protein
MRYPCTVRKLMDGGWLARSLGSDVGNVEVQAASRDEAVNGIREEIRYRLEWCPCSAVAEDYVELDIAEEPQRAFRKSVF